MESAHRRQDRRDKPHQKVACHREVIQRLVDTRPGSPPKNGNPFFPLGQHTGRRTEVGDRHAGTFRLPRSALRPPPLPHGLDFLIVPFGLGVVVVGEEIVSLAVAEDVFVVEGEFHLIKAMGYSDDEANEAIRLSWCLLTPEVDWDGVAERIQTLK